MSSIKLTFMSIVIFVLFY